MGILKGKNKKSERDIELTEEELDKVTAGTPKKNDWCPKVDVSGKVSDELSEEELDQVTAGVPHKDER